MRKIVARQGRRRRHAPVPQQQAAVPVRPARSGLVAGRALHRADRRGAAYDIEVTKKLGFNMARKHVKVEPDRWYYWCDKLGLLVWQDMPSTVDARRHAATREVRRRQFERELKRMIDDRRNHPCIVMWVPFNEGWGQYDTPRIVDVDARSTIRRGWWTTPAAGPTRRSATCSDMHNYPGPGAPKPEADARRGARRVRRPRPAAAGPHLAEPGELGLSQLHDSRAS